MLNLVTVSELYKVISDKRCFKPLNSNSYSIRMQSLSYYYSNDFVTLSNPIQVNSGYVYNKCINIYKLIHNKLKIRRGFWYKLLNFLLNY